MKILLTVTGSWGTGSFAGAKATAKSLIDLGHQVKIFFPDRKLPSPDLSEYYDNPELYEIWPFPIQQGDVRLDSFPLIIPDSNPRVSTHKTFLELTEAEYQLYIQEFERRIKKLIESFQPDIIECQHIWVFADIIHKLGFPYICNALHSDQMAFLYDKKTRPIAKSAADNAQCIFAVSNYVKDEVVSMYNVAKEKVIVTFASYDEKIFKPEHLDKQTVLKNLKIDLPPDARIISVVGALSRTKGMDIILEANKLLSKQENIHFLISGSGKIENVIDPHKKENYLFDRCHFLGQQTPETIAQIHNISVFFLLPSRSEGFAIAGLEAMACSLPIIVTDTSEAKEYAVGKIISSESPQKLAEAIQELMKLSQKEYQIISNQALKKAKEFSWKKITEKRLEYYSAICTAFKKKLT